MSDPDIPAVIVYELLEEGVVGAQLERGADGDLYFVVFDVDGSELAVVQMAPHVARELAVAINMATSEDPPPKHEGR